MKKKTGLVKTVILSMAAIIIFFVPINGKLTPLVMLCSVLKNALAGYKEYILMILVLIWMIKKLIQNKTKGIRMFVMILALFCCGIILLGNKHCYFEHEKLSAIIKEVNSLAFTVVITVSVSGILSVFVTNSGLVEFIASFAESIMKPVLKLPGYAAVDILTSFAASSSIGVYITDKYYKEGRYTLREACFLTSNFSVVSIGFMYFIISTAKMDQYAILIVGCVILFNFVIGAVMIRIDPIKKTENILFDGTLRTKPLEQKQNFRQKFDIGIHRACTRAEKFNLKEVLKATSNSLFFGTGIIIQVLPIYFFTLLLLNYTSIFELCSKPIAWILYLLQIPEAYQIAPASFLGIFEVSMPVIYISQIELPAASRFFVVVLSLVQIIFFTETANAITQSSISFKVIDMVKVFFIRTALAVLMLAVLIQIIY